MPRCGAPGFQFQLRIPAHRRRFEAPDLRARGAGARTRRRTRADRAVADHRRQPLPVRPGLPRQGDRDRLAPWHAVPPLDQLPAQRHLPPGAVHPLHPGGGAHARLSDRPDHLRDGGGRAGQRRQVAVRCAARIPADRLPDRDRRFRRRLRRAQPAGRLPAGHRQAGHGAGARDRRQQTAPSDRRGRLHDVPRAWHPRDRRGHRDRRGDALPARPRHRADAGLLVRSPAVRGRHAGGNVPWPG